MKLAEYSANNIVTNKESLLASRYLMYCRKSTESDEKQIQSLPDQITNLSALVMQKGLGLVEEPLQESRTAKIPGRPMFGQVIQMIEEGRVNGLVVLNPSRISRNTVDTGRIIWLMDQGKLLEVLTPYQTFRNNPNDKFMLNLLCTQAKLENDNKSVNVTEALHLKAERGVFPGQARPGYKNNKEKPQGLRDISPHPLYFPLMRKLFDMALTGTYSVEKLVIEAKNLGIRGINGKPICRSRMHKHLRHPFYTGRIIYIARIFKGQHPAMITDEEFNLLQDILDGKSKGRQQIHHFALNGIMKCGECGFTITAEERVKHYQNGKSQAFSYYRCTKKSKEVKCNQGYMAISKLEDQFTSELTELELKKRFQDWAFEALEEEIDKDINVSKDSSEALQGALDGVNRRIDNLIALKISSENSDGTLLSNEEFADRKRGLMIEKEDISQKIAKLDPNSSEWGQLAKDSFELGLTAAKKFENGLQIDKKIIFKTIGSNQILLDQNLMFQLRRLYFYYKEGAQGTREKVSSLGPKISSSQRANLKEKIKNPLWCPGWESNPHDLTVTGF